jgi:hypothetical protein
MNARFAAPLTPLPAREAMGVRHGLEKNQKETKNLFTTPTTLYTVTGFFGRIGIRIQSKGFRFVASWGNLRPVI